MSFWKVLCLLVVGAVLVKTDEAEPETGGPVEEDKPQWGYHGDHNPSRWTELYPVCSADSLRQSPVNIEHDQTIFNDDLEKLSFYEEIDRRYRTMPITNTGRGVSIQVDYNALVLGGHLPGQGYHAVAIEFHWGSHDKQGAEHRVDSKKFPLEMHVIAYDKNRFASLEDAQNGDNGVAVLSTLYQISEDDNPLLDDLTRNLYKVKESGNESNTPLLRLSELLPRNPNKYFRYLGSLTAPPCSESVIWAVFLHTASISSAQLEKFRQLEEGGDSAVTVNTLVDNWRPVQPIHSRIIYRSFLFKREMSKPVGGHIEAKDSAAIPTAGVATILALLTALLM